MHVSCTSSSPGPKLERPRESSTEISLAPKSECRQIGHTSPPPWSSTQRLTLALIDSCEPEVPGCTVLPPLRDSWRPSYRFRRAWCTRDGMQEPQAPAEPVARGHTRFAPQDLSSSAPRGCPRDAPSALARGRVVLEKVLSHPRGLPPGLPDSDDAPTARMVRFGVVLERYITGEHLEPRAAQAAGAAAGVGGGALVIWP